MVNEFKFQLPQNISDDVNAAVREWNIDNKIAAVWAKDAAVWTDGDEAKWLGWLDVITRELGNLEKYAALRADIGSGGFDDILLLGMGGSSLCPEVLAMTFGKERFHILDSTVPAQVLAVEGKIDVTKTLFIVASKSGSTLEPNCFKQYFYDRVSQEIGSENAGRRFIAITDPGSKMEQVAKADGFRHIFYGDPEIGGRFSALSVFGMTAAAAMGIDVESFLRSASAMSAECRLEDAAANPGAILGIILAICHRHGRDKLTIFTSPEIDGVGAWLEQLIAESTGKNGVAIIPIDREPALSAVQYRDDRIFVSLSVGDGVNSFIDEFAADGHPVIAIRLDDIGTLGQEFFRWEFATAVAGAVMKLDPFDQPDVEAAKIEARKITDEYERTGELPAESSFAGDEAFQFFTGDEYAAKLMAASDGSVDSILRAHIANIGEGDYFGLLAYVEMNAENDQLLQSIRRIILEETAAATCVGFGPRFLHSTGQAYKGGANNGVFLQITSDDATDLDVPGQSFTFGVVKAAQSRGDFQVLVDRGRRALRIHIGADVVGGLEQIVRLLSKP